MQLLAASSLVARDINTGQSVAVAAQDPGSQDFPFTSDRIVFQSPASGLVAGFNDRLPATIVPSTDSIPVMELIFAHQDSSSASAIRIDSLAFQFLAADGSPIYPGDYFSSLVIAHEGDTASIAASLSSTSAIAECNLNSPIVLNPAASETVLVFTDSKSLFSPVDLQIRIERQYITAIDVNDGGRIFGIAGSFPFVAGPARLQLPSDIVLCGLNSLIPANISDEQDGVDVFELIIRNGNPMGYTPIRLNGLRVNLKSTKGQGLDPTGIVKAATLVIRDSTLVSGTINTSEISFTLADSAFQVAAGSNDTIRMAVDIETDMSDESFCFAIEDTSSIDIFDAVSGAPLDAGTIDDVGYPLKTDWTHVLTRGLHGSFTNYPNPFAAGRELTTITYYLENNSTVSLKLYTLWGAPVRTLLDDQALKAGLHQNIKWDGKNGDGDVVNNGVYFLILEIRDSGGKDMRLKRKVGVIR
jgi:hypothetical protein